MAARDFTDRDWNQGARGETTTDRLDRNWRELLQELRIVQTGAQLLTGLLLTIPFHPTFLDPAPRQTVVYVVATGLSVLCAGLLITPVILHRVLFRRHARLPLVQAGQRFAMAGLFTFALAVVGVVELIFDVVAGPDVGLSAAVAAVLLFAVLWGASRRSSAARSRMTLTTPPDPNHPARERLLAP